MVVTFKEIDDVHLSSDSEAEHDEVADKKSKKKQHKKLIQEIDAISGVSKKRSKKTKRNEPSQEVSEFSWSTGQAADGKIGLNDLVGCLETDTKKIASMKKKLRTMESSTKTLEKPLRKPEQQKIERVTAFQETSKDVSKWNDTIQKNREAEHLSFPLQPFRPVKPNITSITNFKPQNDLEREINEVLKGSKHLLERDGHELTAFEEEALKNFDLEEALERRKELQKTRALQSYYEAKCRRQKKIKSKKYRRILKKEKQKSMGKVDLEALSKDNPELFQNELEKAEKLRAMERASLRHRNSSKWAKNLITKGKPNKEDQERIREQLRISRQLTDHKAMSDSDEDANNMADEHGEQEDETNMETNLKLLTAEDGAADNPWLLGNKRQGVEQNSDTEEGGPLKRLEAIVTGESAQKQTTGQVDNDDDENVNKSSGDEWDAGKEEELVQKKKVKRKKKTKQEKLNEANEPAEVISKIQSNVPKVTATTDSSGEKTGKKSKNNKKKLIGESDALKFLTTDTDAVEIGGIPDESDGDVDDDDDDVLMNEQRMNIRDAFANDDVIDDFVRDKESVIEQSKPKAIDLVLPGWGSWGGTGLKVSERKRKRFTKDVDNAKKRRDEGKANVIISEVRHKALAKHQVSQIPFPYTSREEFERSIRQPIGEHWNTQNVVDKLIEPRITTTAGAIIDPIKANKSMKAKKKNTRSKKK